MTHTTPTIAKHISWCATSRDCGPAAALGLARVYAEVSDCDESDAGAFYFADGSAVCFDTSPEGVLSCSILSDRAAASGRNSAYLL